MAFGQVRNNFGPNTFGNLARMYDPNTIRYPQGMSCILTPETEINIDDYLSDKTDNSENFIVPSDGNLKTLIGVYYPGFYEGPMGTWSESEVREALTNDIEDAIYNFSDGKTRLVGADGTGQVTLDFHRLEGTEPNTFANYAQPCKSFGNTGALRQAHDRLNETCPGCDVKHAIILGCPKSSLQPPGQFKPQGGVAIDSTNSFMYTDGMIGYNGANATGGDCGQAPGVEPGSYIPEDSIDLLKNGGLKMIVLHEILHTCGWPHNSIPVVMPTGEWCPPLFMEYGPQLPCSDGPTGNYASLDNLDLMSFGGGCTNPYNVFKAHPSAATKYIRGLGLSTNEMAEGEDNTSWLPDNAVISIDPSLSPMGGAWGYRLYAQDTNTETKSDILRDATTGASHGDAIRLDSEIPYLIKIKRPVDSSQSIDTPYDPLERYIFLEYRMNSWYARKEEHSAGNGDPSPWSEGGYLNGSFHASWGPVNIGFGRAGILPLAKVDAMDTRTDSEEPNLVFKKYTAAGIEYPQLDIKIMDNPGVANTRHGPESIVVWIRSQFNP
jgi:hypothetical protein